MISKSNITGIILAGGNSRRMGEDKGMLHLDNKTFMRHIEEAMLPLVNSVMLISNHLAHDVFDIDRYNDLIPNAGPLAGIYTGLHYSKTEYNLILSCDVPLITTAVLRKLIDHAGEYDVIQFQVDNQTMPLAAMYRKSCSTILSNLLKEGERRLQKAIELLKVKNIVLHKDDWKSLINVNTKEELTKVTNYD